ncbi:hypothetical protein [Campylobacter concisus]|nr:hypothetical protein [Campylobacter concisus]
MAGAILATEIYIAVCVKGGFVRHYAGGRFGCYLAFRFGKGYF